ncbi:MAG TPA: hypothetical protein VFS31_11915, partial [Chitinophagaceae bacterium]|nr:hypothetical protein [Chitinophagaceae bacterium]
NNKEADLLGQQATIKLKIRLQEQANEEEAQKKEEAANKKAEAEAKRHAKELEREYKKHLAELQKAAERAIKLRNDIQGPVSGGGTDPIIQFLKEQNKFAGLTQLQGNGPRIVPNIPKDTLNNIKKQYGELAGLLNNTLTPAFESMFDAINSGQNAFEALGKAIVRSIEQLIAQLAAMAAVAGILSLITGGAAGGGLSFMSAFNSFSGIKIPHMAGGGIVPSGFSGDRFPAMLNSGEAVIPLDRLPSLIGQMGMGNVTLQPSIHYDATGFRVMLNRVDKSINRRY